MTLTYRGIPYKNQDQNQGDSDPLLTKTDVPITQKELTYRGIPYTQETESNLSIIKEKPETKTISSNKIKPNIDTNVSINGISSSSPNFSPYISPQTVVQLYQQRWTVIKAGQIYTLLQPDSFQSYWVNATQEPTNHEWEKLLEYEANAISKKQNAQFLNILLGDFLSLWFPLEMLSPDQLWLNQSMEKDTTEELLTRLSLFKKTEPHIIYLMIGINDLLYSSNDLLIPTNISQIIDQIHLSYKSAKIVVQSILPTNTSYILPARIRQVNHYLQKIALEKGVNYLNLYDIFRNQNGEIKPELTTDGLHLSYKGYALWQSFFKQIKP